MHSAMNWVLVKKQGFESNFKRQAQLVFFFLIPAINQVFNILYLDFIIELIWNIQTI